MTGNLVFCSGQIPTDPATGQLAKGGVKEHTLQCIKNLGVVLTEAGSSLEKVVKCNVYIADMSDFEAVNEGYVVCIEDEAMELMEDSIWRCQACPDVCRSQDAPKECGR